MPARPVPQAPSPDICRTIRVASSFAKSSEVDKVNQVILEKLRADAVPATFLTDNWKTLVPLLTAFGLLGPGQAFMQEQRVESAMVPGTQAVLDHYSVIIEARRVQVEDLQEDLEACREAAP